MSRGDEATKSDEIEGTILEVLPGALFAVRLGDGRRVLAGIAAPARHGIVRLLPGEAVSVRLSENDPLRGSIRRKL
ncbi:MAG: translation initiation factor IF-1 [Deltaproteobacteria bacterium]|nr:translation initiation factor IF-1 [Deltaproteobacteria bacterium]